VSDLDPERLTPLLRGSFGKPFLHFARTASTQDVLRQGDYPHGTVAAAEHQTAGRGRSGRRWDGAETSALLFSLQLRPPAAADLPQLSLVAGLAVAEALERVAGAPMLVKWPNDVLGGGGKVAGMLLEASGESVVCGIGINVNQEAGDLPVTARVPATSLRILSGRLLDRGLVLAEVLAGLERRYEDWLAGGLPALIGDLEARNAVRGARVRAGDRVGTAAEIAPDGRLVVVLDRGDRVLVESGEVEIVLARP